MCEGPCIVWWLTGNGDVDLDLDERLSVFLLY